MVDSRFYIYQQRLKFSTIGHLAILIMLAVTAAATGHINHRLFCNILAVTILIYWVTKQNVPPVTGWSLFTLLLVLLILELNWQGFGFDAFSNYTSGGSYKGLIMDGFIFLTPYLYTTMKAVLLMPLLVNLLEPVRR